MGYVRKYKIESGPRGWTLHEYDTDINQKAMWVELGKYNSESDAIDAMKRTARKSVRYFGPDGEEV
jgi:hypothetical protein